MQNQFENLYKLKPPSSSNNSYINRENIILNEQISFQNNLKNRPLNINYFEKLMYSKDNKKKSEFRIGYLCNTIPKEILNAFGAEAVRLDCGNGAFTSVGEEVLSGDVCPLVKSTVGLFLNSESIANSCDLIIIPTSCDAKKKLGEILSDFKPVFMLNLPIEQNHSLYAKNVETELFRLIEFLEKNFKTKLNKSKLIEQIQISNEQSRLIKELYAIRKLNPKAISILDFLLIIQSVLFKLPDIKEWLGETKKLIDEIKLKENKIGNVKLVLTGSPIIWPNFKILNLIEESGADIVSETNCSGMQSLFDEIVIYEKNINSILQGLASKYIFSSICPCFISQTKRINRILEIMEDTKAKGIINYTLRLCQVFDIESYRLDKIFKKNNIAYLNIKTDYSLEDKEQLRIRIEAFLEKLI